MAIYELRHDGLVAVPVTTFASEGLRERSDLQRLLRDRIAAIQGELELMVLTDEFDGWVDSLRRIDLLCLDKSANLVVVEPKRDEDGGYMELQAIRYAAMVSEMTFEEAVGTLARHRRRTDPSADADAARSDILAFLDWSAPDEGRFGSDTRIFLVAAGFGKEVTTTVLCLRDRGIDIRCVRLAPYKLNDGRLVVDVQQVVPLPEIADFQTKIGTKRAVKRREQAERHDLRVGFLSALLDQAAGRSAPHADRTPSTMGVLYGSIGKASFSINYVTGEDRSRVEFLIQSRDAEEQLTRLKQHRDEIERAFGGKLDWQEKDGTRQRRILHRVEGGYRSDREHWPSIHDELLDAMLRLDHAVRPRVAALP